MQIFVWRIKVLKLCKNKIFWSINLGQLFRCTFPVPLIFIHFLLYVRKEIPKANFSFCLSESVTVTQQFKIIQPHVATENDSLITKTFKLAPAQCTVHHLSISQCYTLFPSIPHTVPVPLLRSFVSTYVTETGTVVTIWRFYTSVNVLQWYKLLWIGCYAIWRFYKSVNVLQWFKLLWIGCYAIWRFYLSLNVLQLI